MTIPYPSGPRAPLDLNPQLLVIYGQSKVGKTDSVSQLPGCLTLVLRAGSADHLAGNIMDIARLCEQGAFGAFPVDKDEQARNAFICHAYMSVLEDLYQKQAAGCPPYEYIAHDDLGVIEEWVFDLALENFLGTLAGKSARGQGLKRVTDLPGQSGSPGWAYVWEEFDRMMWRIRRASPRAILIAHMKDKMVNKETGEVSDTDIDITGKMRKILLREASATGFMFRDRDSNLVVSFKNASGINCGAWCRHLVGREIVLGELDGERRTVCDWSAIYPKQEAK